MKTNKEREKMVYSKPQLTVHGNVEQLTQTYRCVRHHVYNCCICHCPSS